MQRFEQMQTDLATHMQGGPTAFLFQNKARWEDAQKDLMDSVHETNATKRKSEATDPPSLERTATAASTTLADTDPAFDVTPAAVPPAAPQLPQNQVLPAQSTQAAVAPAAVHTQEARAAAASAEKEARCNKLRADAMAKAAVQMAKDSSN